MEYQYKGETYEVYSGKRGGQYIVVNGRKKYIKSLLNPTTPERKIRTTKLGDVTRGFLSAVKHTKTCCVCGKELTKTDTDYYDLTDYCIDCAIADGIRTSKD